MKSVLQSLQTSSHSQLFKFDVETVTRVKMHLAIEKILVMNYDCANYVIQLFSQISPICCMTAVYIFWNPMALHPG